MKLWISGRIDDDIEGPIFSHVLREVRDVINSYIENKDYGPEIKSWDVIMVIFKEKIAGSFKYNARTKETDIEIPIDHNKFKTGDIKDRKMLFFDALVLSLQQLKENKRLKEFPLQRVIDDITAIAEKEVD